MSWILWYNTNIEPVNTRHLTTDHPHPLHSLSNLVFLPLLLPDSSLAWPRLCFAPPSPRQLNSWQLTAADPARPVPAVSWRQVIAAVAALILRCWSRSSVQLETLEMFCLLLSLVSDILSLTHLHHLSKLSWKVSNRSSSPDLAPTACWGWPGGSRSKIYI